MSNQDFRSVAELLSIPIPDREFADTRVIFENRFMSLYSAPVDFGDFRKDYFVTRYKKSVQVLVVDDDKVLLTAQYRYLIDGLSLEIPGGNCAEAEAPADAARRECFEETGVWCEHLEPFFRTRAGEDTLDTDTSVFYCDRPTRKTEFVPKPSEVLGIGWVPFDDCLSAIRKGEIVNLCTVAAVLRYLAFVKAG